MRDMNHILDNISERALKELATVCQNQCGCISCQARARIEDGKERYSVLGIKLGN